MPEQRRRGPGWHASGGAIFITRAGTVLSGIRTRLSVEVMASDVVVRDNLLLTQGEHWGIGLRRAKDVTLAHNTIEGGTGNRRLLVGIKQVSGNVPGLRVVGNDISRASTGIQLDQGLVEGNYVHALGHIRGDHLNGFTSNQGKGGLRIRGNTFFNPYRQTDAISLFQDFGRQYDVVIENNLVAGGGYSIYAGANAMGRYGRPSSIVVRHNRFSVRYFPQSGYFGPAAAFARGAAGNHWYGNFWDTRPQVAVRVP